MHNISINKIPRMTMTNSNDPSLSRRKWLGLAAGASLGSGLLALTGTAEAQTKSPAKHANDAHTAHPTHPHPTSDRNLGANIYNIRDFGAKGDGVTSDTAAVQAAIDACNRDRGGTVMVPAGDFLIGTVELKSNVALHLSAQGRLLGSTDIAEYHPGRGIPPGNGNLVLVAAADAENVSIEG